ncbi:Transcriptional regulator, PadR family [hydrothermal vent metagenome]|uniref:Transcriptional regulator, PadR family n=1 Tax=hydrothermal vent metagenome TaxID=652676 RepID=A0A3B0TU21_9ZZZZ
MNVKILCLGILHFGDATGYEIRKMTQEGRFGHFIEASYGSIYPALIALEKEGLVVSRKESQAGRPNRKVYSINEAGRATFVAALYNKPRDDVFKSEFLLVMLCAELVSQPYITKLIDDRLNHLDNHIAQMRDVSEDCGHACSQFVLGFGLAIYEAERKYLAEHRQNLETIAKPAALSLEDGAELGNAAE